MGAKSRPAAKFPQDFVWGAATSSYQIEGGWDRDGKGESIWDRFSHTPGKIHGGDSGDVACDHYHRWPDDVALMKSLGLPAYRFSISWPRIFPSGTGPVNQAGLDFYASLVDGLLEAGIEPYPVLYHWDLPQALQDRGGWPARDTAHAFAEYAGAVSRSLGDRVHHWMTLNEPFVSAYVGHLEGRHAPGHRNVDEMAAAAHHLLLAHGMAIPVLRANTPGCSVGIVLNLNPVIPASESESDATETRVRDGVINRWYLDPLAGREYPPDIIEHFNLSMPFIQPGDLEAIAAPLDFLGINYYTRTIARSSAVPEAENLPPTIHPAGELTEMGWEVYPRGLFEVLEFVHEGYPFPQLLITENGAAFPDVVEGDTHVVDPSRVRFIDAHLRQALRAIEAGIPLHGYFVWSLLDNFEWAYGFSKRFGLVYVDFETQERVIKDSARWYAQVIASGELPGPTPG